MVHERLAPRVRIAPSPTGDPHVGTAYIALFNFVFAKKYQGSFILRIEDTDQNRSSPGSEVAIYEALHWLGLEWDEGPDKGGAYGPYRQSERLDIYHQHVEHLLSKGAAYRCFCSKERLDQLRQLQQTEKLQLGYDGACRSIPPQEAQQRAQAGEQHTVRLKVPQSGQTLVVDELRGELMFENHLIDDQVILKSDGFPTYHLANVVDDHLMKITHVIRGEEWITSTPKHILLYQAFGWEPPRFYHLGLLRNADKSKLSKRKNPVSVFHYRDLGYLPHTFINFLATLGFSFGDDQEHFSLEQMIERFDWSRVSPGGPIFDPVKLEAFNAADLRALSADEFYQQLHQHVFAPERIRSLITLVQERITRLDDFIPFASFFFGGSLDYTQVLPQFRLPKRSRKEIIEVLLLYSQEIETNPQAREFTKTSLEEFSRQFCQQQGWKTRELFSLLRLVVTGRTAAPPLFDTMVCCGKDRVRLRIRDVVTLLKQEQDW